MLSKLESTRFKAWFSVCSGVGLALYLFCSILSQLEAANKLTQEDRISEARIEMQKRRTAYFKAKRMEYDRRVANAK